MDLEYLHPFKERVDLSKLIEIKQLREKQLLRDDEIKSMLIDLPPVESLFDPASVDLSIQTKNQIEITKQAQQLIPWKKGPFRINDLFIDSEWRSDLKWERLKEKVNLNNKVVLDIGCNNGYFMFRALEQNPRLMLGIDPVARCFNQYHFINHFLPDNPTRFELFGMEEVSYFKEVFDTIFHMGIIYHHRDPIRQLRQIHQALKPGGELIIETIGIDGEESTALFPEDRYANMKNVWFVPTLSALINWLKRTKFEHIEILSTQWENTDEQRTTSWCPEGYKSFEDFLDPHDSSKTIEGYPAPQRFCIKVKKKGKS